MRHLNATDVKFDAKLLIFRNLGKQKVGNFRYLTNGGRREGDYEVKSQGV